MPENPLTLSVMCGLDADASGLPLKEQDRTKALQAIRSGLAKFHLGFGALDTEIFKAIAEYLRKPVADILGEAWRQRKELREIAEKGEDGRKVAGTVDLYDHSIKFAVHPSIKLLENGVAAGKVSFHVETNFKLEAIKLVIENACITRVKTGKLTASTTFKCEEFPLVSPCNKSLDLPVSLDLPRGGIPLGRAVRAPETPVAYH